MIKMSNDYLEYRGKCKKYSEKLCEEDTSLRLVRGYYYCPIWGSKQVHWWCEKPDGTVVDPTVKQFPSKGVGGIYEEFDGVYECAVCGKRILEEKAIFESRYALCSSQCHMKFFFG